MNADTVCLTRTAQAALGLLLVVAPGHILRAQAEPRLDDIVSVGARTPERSASQSPVPVDVLSRELLRITGAVETWRQLQRLVPSLNVPHIPSGDNHFRPVTLRGLAPHHVLVLVNGKRRHPAATLLTGPSVPATSFTDLGNIPTSAIERIEVLRDGASAQYGSDAIGGVVNVVLRSDTRSEVELHTGTVLSSEGGRSFSDGRDVTLGGSWGLATASGARLSLSAEFQDRGGTNRAYPDRRPQYFAGDPRNESAPVVSSYLGQGSMTRGSLLLDAGVPLGHATEAYSFAGMAERRGITPDAFFRRPLDNRTVRSLHPDGFLPEITSVISDLSVVAGVRGTLGHWRWDLSSGWGRNGVSYDVAHSNNASLGSASPTRFDVGDVATSQWTGGIDMDRALVVAGMPVNLALGAALRVERFTIGAGEPDSWRDGEIPILDGPAAGQPAPVGAQGMFGFRPEDEVRAQRHSTAAYLEVAGHPIPSLLLQAAARAERYSDAGGTVDGKIAARLSLGSGLAVRGSISSGFRAPVMMQQHYASSRVVFQPVNGHNTVLLVRNFPVGSPEARLMGAVPLRPEQAVNHSIGLVLDRPGIPLVTLDAYQVGITDRINLGAVVTDSSIIRLFDENGMRGLGGGNYFANAIDTRTRGVDLVASHAVLLGHGGVLRALGGFSHARTVVTRVAPAPAALAAFGQLLFNRTSRGVIEQGQPRQTISFTLIYSGDRLGITLHNQRSGPTAQLDRINPDADQHLRPHWITDARLAWRVRRHITVALSAENIFDVYPDEWMDFKHGLEATGVSMQGIFRHPGALSPFGMNGRTVRLHLDYR